MSKVTPTQRPVSAQTWTEEICYRVDCRVVPDGDTFYATVRGLPVHVGGTTEEEALENAIIGTMCHISSLLKHGEPIPLPVIKKPVKPPAVAKKPTKSHKRSSRHTGSVCLGVGRPALT